MNYRQIIKVLPFLIFNLSFFSSFGQTFHIKDTAVIINNLVDQSPAHWYIVITPNVSSDTTLRWEATRFIGIPQEWEVTMSDPDTLTRAIKIGDYSDFKLTADDSFANMLVIGVFLNNTPGNGVVFFDVYDPNDTNYKQTISYELNINPLPTNSGIQETETKKQLKIENGFLKINDAQLGDFHVFDISGKKIATKYQTNTLNLKTLPKNQILLFQVQINNRIEVIKLSL